ncbi:zincin-like metallopeptidase domain-containing protein, partial [Mycobacterium tuberculosis]
ELVASIGQCLICADLGLPGELHDNHASYIDHWLGLWRGEHKPSNREVSIM